jgi:hypothetical protein
MTFNDKWHQLTALALTAHPVRQPYRPLGGDLTGNVGEPAANTYLPGGVARLGIFGASQPLTRLAEQLSVCSSGRHGIYIIWPRSSWRRAVGSCWLGWYGSGLSYGRQWATATSICHPSRSASRRLFEPRVLVKLEEYFR